VWRPAISLFLFCEAHCGTRRQRQGQFSRIAIGDNADIVASTAGSELDQMFRFIGEALLDCRDPDVQSALQQWLDRQHREDLN
jgi:hypothetical protein